MRFKVTATDADGNEMPDPDPNPFCMGGIGCSPKLKPGESWYQSLQLWRYRRIEKPGKYTIRAKHDFGWEESEGRKFPEGEVTIELKEPSEEQAEKIVGEMLVAGPDRGWSYGEKRTKLFADFLSLQHPAYLPALARRMTGTNVQVLAGVASIATPKATRVLIDHLDHKDAAYRKRIAGCLFMRLPDPQLEGKLGKRNVFHNDRESQRKRLVEKAWRDEFRKPLLEQGRLWLTAADAGTLANGAFVLECLGSKDDLPHLLKALDRGLEISTTLELEEGCYPRPRGCMQELMRAANILIARGCEITLDPKTPGEAAVMLRSLVVRKDDRPKGWVEAAEGQLGHPIAYIRELALQSATVPLPAGYREKLPGLLRDRDLDVRIQACSLAARSEDKTLLADVLGVVRTESDDMALGTAYSAAQGLGGGYEALEVVVSRLPDTNVMGECMGFLCDLTGGGGRSGTLNSIGEGVRLKARWGKFLSEHEQEIREGRKFKLAEPPVTADLFPASMWFHVKGKVWPPGRGPRR